MTDLNDLGVQRVVVNLYNHFSERIEPALILWRNEGKIRHFLNSRGKIYETDTHLSRPRLIRRLKVYRQILAEVQPVIILSFVPVTNISMAWIRSSVPHNIPMIACEHAFLTRAFSTREYRGLFKPVYRMMIPGMYNKIFDKLIMTAEAGIEDAVRHWKIRREKIVLIYNPQDIDDIRARANERFSDEWFDDGIPVIIGAGRLTAQKGFDKLLKAFKILRERHKVRLAILGRGELEGQLKALARELGLSDHVKFLGFQTNHLKYIKKSSIFVLSSIWEAMPMVVGETMAVGTPIVSFDCPSGPRELLDHGRCGFLVRDQDVVALADEMTGILRDEGEARRRADLASKRVEEFSVEIITKKYEDLLFSVVEGRGRS